MVKNFKTLMAVTAAFCLMASSCSAIEKVIPSFENTSDKTASSVSGYTPENICEKLSQEISCIDHTVRFDGLIDLEIINEGINIFKMEKPEFFWLNGYAVTTGSDYTEIDFYILNDYSAQDCVIMLAELENTANEIISQIPAGSSDYDKVLFVHDYIVENTVYDSEGAESPFSGIWGTAYGCLVNGSAVCQGYTEAFMYVIRKLGIESGLCTGETSTGRHSWNYVLLDGNYYWLDLTWDDAENDALSHSYFLINDDMLLRDRTIDENQYFVPTCDSLDMNYYVVNGCYLTEYDVDYMTEKFVENGENHRIAFMFADENSYETAIKSLFDDGDIWEISEKSKIEFSDNVFYSQFDTLLILDINY